MNPSEYATIAKHIRANLELALDVAEVLPMVRGELIAESITELKKILEANSEPSGLQVVETFTANPLAKEASISTRHRSWPDGVTVCIEAESYGARNVFAGVAFEPPASVPVGLLETLNNEVRRGLSEGNQWKWWYRLHDPYQHWDNKQAVLAFGAAEAPRALADQMLAIICVAHPFLSMGAPREQ